MSQGTPENHPHEGESQKAAGPAPPAGERSYTEDDIPPPRQGGGKLGFTIIGFLVIALLIAAFIHSRFYGGAPEQEGAGEEPALEAIDDEEPVFGEKTGRQDQPELSKGEIYRRFLMQSRLASARERFRAGDRVFAVAKPGGAVQQTVGGEMRLGLAYGRLFELTEMAEGVERIFLFRRSLRSAPVMYANALPVLGIHEDLMPLFATAEEAELEPDQRVIGLTIKGEAKAYPVKFMNIHEVVNDELGGAPVVVVWSALAGAPLALDRRIGEDVLTFGTAGLSYQGIILIYDSATLSLWSPATGKGLTHTYADSRLKPLQTTLLSWRDWRDEHPETEVLVGSERNLNIDYTQNPQLPTEDYYELEEFGLPVEHFDLDQTPIPAKATIFGLRLDDRSRAYPLEALSEGGAITDTLAGRKVTITLDEAGTAAAVDAEGNPLLLQRMYWIAWKGNHPGSDVYGVASSPASEEPPFREGG